jgi:hypothetical protein
MRARAYKVLDKRCRAAYNENPMRKFYIQSLKGKTSIIEVEGELMMQSEDPCTFWSLKPGEYFFKIAKPASLAGERLMSFAFADTVTAALEVAYESINGSLQLQLRKGHITDDQLGELTIAAAEAIEIVKLK